MSTAPESPVVGIVMGSDSDWPVMEAAAQALDEFEIAYEVDVVSAHRMPREMIAYGEEAAYRGIKVIIAGAGGAAHLPGMLASVTPLPVIGVPVPLKHLDGMDSLLSIVQMPAGVPVATVSVAACAQCRTARGPHPRCPRRGTPRPYAGVPAGTERPGFGKGQAAARQDRGRRGLRLRLGELRA